MAVGYPAPGNLLPLAYYSGSTYPEPVWTTGSDNRSEYTPVIPDGSYSMPESLDQFQTFRLMIKYDGSPGDITTLEIATDPTFADAQTLDTLPSTAATASFWTSAQGVTYSGFLRINNTTGGSILGVYIQGQVASVG